MAWEHTVRSKRAAREERLDAGLLSLPRDVASPIDVERTNGQTLLSKLAGGEVTTQQVIIKAIHK